MTFCLFQISCKSYLFYFRSASISTLNPAPLPRPKHKVWVDVLSYPTDLSSVVPLSLLTITYWECSLPTQGHIWNGDIPEYFGSICCYSLSENTRHENHSFVIGSFWNGICPILFLLLSTSGATHIPLSTPAPSLVTLPGTVVSECLKFRDDEKSASL